MSTRSQPARRVEGCLELSAPAQHHHLGEGSTELDANGTLLGLDLLGPIHRQTKEKRAD